MPINNHPQNVGFSSVCGDILSAQETDNMAEVGKALRKAGYAKPKAVRKAKPAPATPEPDASALSGKATPPKPARKPRTPKAKSPGSDTGENE